MSQFEFRGTSRSGQTVSGVRMAPSREAVDASLRREAITPLKIVEKGREIAVPKFKWGEKVKAK